MEFIERRLDVADPPSGAGDTDPQEQGKRRRQLGFARHPLGLIERRGVLVNAGVKRQCMDRDQHEQRQLDPEKDVVVILFRLGAGQQKPAGGHDQESDPLGPAELIDQVGNRLVAQHHSQQTQVGHQDRAGEQGDPGQMTRQEGRINIGRHAKGGGPIGTLNPLREFQHRHSLLPRCHDECDEDPAEDHAGPQDQRGAGHGLVQAGR